MKDFILKNKYLISIILFAVVSIFVSYFYIGYSSNLGKSDAFEYFRAAKFLEGNPVDGNMQLDRVLTTPAFLYSSIILNYFVNDFSTSFAVVNIIFYFLCIITFYYLALEIYKNGKVAFLSSVLVVFNFYVIDPGNSHLADMGGWFFFLLGTLYALKYINTLEKKFFYYSIISAAVGVFFKEYGGLALINLALLILVSEIPWKQKIKDIFWAGTIVLAPILSFHIFIYLKYGFLYLHRYVAVDKSTINEEPKTFILLVKILGWLFSFGYLAFLYGAWQEWKIRDSRRIKILLAMLPVTLTFYIWPSITQRLAVMLMMWLSLTAGFGLSKVKWYVFYPFLGIYLWFNFNIKFLIDKINLPFH